MESQLETRWCVGVDPGLSGGLVRLLCGPGGAVIDVVATPMPATEHDVWDWFLPLIGTRSFAAVEKITGYVGDGGNPGSAMFRFGTNYGLVRMALVAACVPFEQVTPQRWQKDLGVPHRNKGEGKPEWKNRLKSHAQRLFPTQKVTLATADALLIAEHCRRSTV